MPKTPPKEPGDDGTMSNGGKAEVVLKAACFVHPAIPH